MSGSDDRSHEILSVPEGARPLAVLAAPCFNGLEVVECFLGAWQPSIRQSVTVFSAHQGVGNFGEREGIHAAI